ncbi:MAG: hypothetical protein IJM97_01995 [Clostridia bacterium]|nr:hypothetical protein [Clostridia bacterium]
MAIFLNILNRVFAGILATLLGVTGAVNNFFTGEVYEYKSETAVFGVEALSRSQDVTTDGKAWIYSGKNYLEKVSLDNSKILAADFSAIPDEIAEKYNSKHIGGISYYDGIIYAAVEDSKEWNHPLILLYDAETLEFTGTYYELSTKHHIKGVPWVIVDGENKIAYAGDSKQHNKIFMYKLENFEYIGEYVFNTEIKKIQGGEYYGGKLYFGTNDMTRAVYSLDVKSGEITKLFDRIMYEYKLIDNFGGEGEGLTILKRADGTTIHTLQLGTLFVDSSLRHYEWELN